jgi:cytochrome c551/c552
VNGKGAQVGPDLGRIVDRNFTPAALAATMWNHAPTMWAAMRERSIRTGDLDEQAAADLFAYFYSARFFEKPGDAGRGKRVFSERGCAQCHGLTTPVKPDIKPVSQWRSLNSPIGLAEEMWNHLPRMQAAAGASKIRLPQLDSQELTDLLVYLRNLPAMRNQPAEFETGSGASGEALFQSKGCARCHATGAAFAGRIKGRTLTEIAAAMWNHAPRMAAAGAKPASFDAGEMRELLSYLWAKQFFEGAGDAGRGKRVFTEKRCATCHDDSTSGAPKLVAAKDSTSAAGLVAALWRHGPAMLERMRSRNIPWPQFGTREMSDLIAYLNSRSSAK